MLTSIWSLRANAILAKTAGGLTPIAKTQKTGKSKIHKGKKINEYSDGCWRYDRAGGIAIRSPNWGGNLTSATAGAMQKRGQEVIAAKKQEAILRRAKEHLSLETASLITLPADVAAEAAAELYMEVFERDNPLRDRVHAYKEVGADDGFVDKRSGGGGVQAIQVNINISEEAADKVESQFEILEGIYKSLDDE